MKANLLLVVSVLLSGCSVSVTPNKTTVDTIVETFEFRVTNKEVAMDKSVNFVNQINLQYPKSTFAINYDAKESQFVDGFVKEIKAKGVNKLRYTLNANSESKGVKSLRNTTRCKSKLVMLFHSTPLNIIHLGAAWNTTDA